MKNKIKFVDIEQEDHDKLFSLQDEMAACHYLLQLLIDAPKKLECPCCGNSLIEFDGGVFVDLYEHEYGWKVALKQPKQWASIHCDECDYDVSINKFGIGR